MQKVFYYDTTKYFLFLPIFGRVILCYFPEELYRNFVFMIKLIIFATAFLENSETIIQYIAGWSSWQLVGLITRRS